jgi:two-component system NtrC family sensor kinase
MGTGAEARAQLAGWPRLLQSTLNALSLEVAILQADGRILAVNRAWFDFAQANAEGTHQVTEGANYVAVCDAAQGPESPEAAAFATLPTRTPGRQSRW